MYRVSSFGHHVALFLLLGASAVQPSGAAAQDKPPGTPDGATKRRPRTTEDELRKQLLSVPEAGFDQPAAGELYTPIIKSMQATPPLKQLSADLGLKSLEEKAA